MMRVAQEFAQMSTCQRLQVGSVITDEAYGQLAVGYNGTYKGGPNECLHSDVPGSCGCIHSEINALIKMRFTPYHMFVTDSPCESCASAIINGGIRRLIYLREYRLTAGIELLRKAGVQVEQIMV